MRAVFSCLSIVLALTNPAAAQSPSGEWAAQKCAAYAAAWDQALEAFDSDQVNYAFLAGNENFIASGCTDAADICPRSDVELAMANALTLAAMNAGAASTFLPFGCPHPGPSADGWSGPGL